MFNKRINLNNQDSLNEKDEIRLEIWGTSLRINSMDKNYKTYRKQDVKEAIKDGVLALGIALATYICNLTASNPPTFADSAIEMIGPIGAAISALSSSLHLGNAFSYKIRKKSLENKLENLKTKQDELMGIIEVKDYEIISSVDDDELDNQLLLEQNEKLEGGKYVR